MLKMFEALMECQKGSKANMGPETKKPPANLRIQAPKKYDGKPLNLKNFERSFRNYAKLSMANDDTIKVALGTYFDDSAARWYEQL